MPVEYTGPLTFPITLFRNLLSASEKFQAWTGDATPGEAFAKTWPMLAGLQPTPNFAIVALGDEWASDSIAGGTEDTWRDAGTVEIEFVGTIQDRDNIPLLQQDIMTFLQSINDVLTDLKRLGVEGENGYVMLKKMWIADRMYLAPDDATTDFICVAIGIAYGL